MDSPLLDGEITASLLQAQTSAGKVKFEDLMKASQPWEKTLRSIRHAKARDLFRGKYLGRCFGEGFDERKMIGVEWAAGESMNNGTAQWVLISELIRVEPARGTEQRTHEVAKHNVVKKIRARNHRVQL